MNAAARLLALCCLLLPAACSAAGAQDARDKAIQTALDGSVLGCQTALNDASTKWGPGAREWCERLVSGCHDTVKP